MATANDVERARRDGELFGIPLGDLGWFASLLMALTTGMIAFFLATFVSIVSMLTYQGVSGHHVDFALAYLRGGLPVGGVVMVASIIYFSFNWARRMARKRSRAV